MDCLNVCLETFWLQECEFVLEDCHKRSCWENPIWVSVPRPYRSDVYVCSKSFWLCLTVVCWLFGVQWSSTVNRTPEYVTLSFRPYGLFQFRITFSELHESMTFCRISLDEWSARRKACAYTGQHNTHTQKHKHPCFERNSNPRSQKSSRQDLTPWTARPTGIRLEQFICVNSSAVLTVTRQTLEYSEFRKWVLLCISRPLSSCLLFKNGKIKI
jgi:hypothetical protein